MGRCGQGRAGILDHRYLKIAVRQFPGGLRDAIGRENTGYDDGVNTAGAKLAFVVGPSAIVGDVKTDMIVWANDDVFLQLWIGSDDKLPRRIRAQFSADPQRLRHDMELSHWQLDGVLPDQTFSTAKAKAGQPMAFAAPGRKVPIGVKPVAIGGAARPAAKPQ